jgi:hypothetical protein
VTGFVASLETRLRASDVTQIATLVMAALVVALALAWPSAPGASNEAWYGFAQARGVIVALLAMGFGATAASERARRGVASGLVVVLIALLTVPLEIAAYAATYPATPLWWSAVGVTLAPAAYFAIGVGLGAVATRARLRLFLPLLVPALLIGLVVLDVRLGGTVFNPLTAPLEVSGTYVLVSSLLALAAVAWAVGRWRGSTPADDAAVLP